MEVHKEPIQNSENRSLVVKSRSLGFDICDRYTNVQVRCSDDCTAMEICMKGRIFHVDCLLQTGKKYCDISTNQCSDSIDVCYNSEDFCPDDGIYPDLTNCQRYVYCDGHTVHPYQCDYNTIYDYKTKTCVPDTTCATFSMQTGCRDSYNLLVKHPNPRWFVFCDYNKPLLGECPGSNYTFDPDLGTCRFQCGMLNNNSLPGKYGDDFDKSVYYTCYKVGNKWQTSKKKCPPNTFFREDLQICA